MRNKGHLHVGVAQDLVWPWRALRGVQRKLKLELLRGRSGWHGQRADERVHVQSFLRKQYGWKCRDRNAGSLTVH